jgi:hypothetical protein
MSAFRSVRRVVAVTALLLSIATFAGCSGDDSDSPGATGPFESDLPNASHGESAGASEDSGGLDFMGVTNSFRSAGANPGAMVANGNKDVSREIVEADVVQLSGDRLYVLSREAGFAVVDVADPSALKILGRYRELPGTPFEMYLRGDVAILMFTGWSEYVKLEDGKYRSVTTSKIVALDVADPTGIAEIGSLDVPGSISDSRIVGDVLYVAGFEDGSCWNCEQNKQTTSVSSLSVADPRDMKKVDELRYSDATGQYSWQRSITVTDQRMYVAGPEYGNNGPIGSTIQVIDISDASGDLVEGATLQARGQISSRWQMDEYDGVFRVVSQPGQWQTADPPRLQTFKVISSMEFQPLARLDLAIPARETLQSARFDGPRGYLITAERKDPLFTLDLSDPTKPRQVGELVMPGFVYHMEPRGDRVLGLGFDQGNPEGSITVSLFDVSDLASPKMLSRVNFGGDWGSLPEDQDRIHKVFRVLPEAGLLLVPFTGYERSGDNYCGGNSVGGVQLIDYANDRLTGRGSADSEFNVRRALLVDDYLFAVSDQRVESYSIANRSAPKKLATQAVLSSNVQYAAQLNGDMVARLVSPNWSSHWAVEIVSKANAEDVDQRLGELSLDSVFDAPATDDKSCKPWWNIESFHADGSLLYLVYNGWLSTRTTNESEMGVVVIDASNPAKPTIAGRTSWHEPQTNGGWSTYYGNSFSGFGQATPYLWHDRVLAFFEQKYTTTSVNTSKMSVRLRVVDLRDPEALKATTLVLGDNREYSGLIADGAQIVTSHYDYDPTSVTPPTRIKYFADRIDVSNAQAPKLLAPVNIPGVVVHYDSASGRAVTSLLRRVVVSGVKYNDCYSRFSYADFMNTNVAKSNGPVEDWVGTCTGFTQSLQLVALRADGAVLEDTLALAENQQVNAFSGGDGRLFATLSTASGNYFRGEPGSLADCFDCGGGSAPEPDPVQLLVLSGFGSGEFTIGRLEYKSGDQDYWRGFWGASGVVADGTKALVLGNSEAAIVDASDGEAPVITRTLPLLGYTSSIDIQDGTALLAFGQQGLQLIDM